MLLASNETLLTLESESSESGKELEALRERSHALARLAKNAKRKLRRYEGRRRRLEGELATWREKSRALETAAENLQNGSGT